MAVRIIEGGYAYMEPMAGASTAGSGLVYDDGQQMPPWEDRPGYGQNDMIASEALRLMNIPREQIRMTRPPVPMRLFPDRFGYEHEPIGIGDLFDDGMWTPQPRSWAAPTVRTVRRAFEEDTFSGSPRGVSVNPAG